MVPVRSPPTPTPTPTPAAPAAGCPTGTVDRGVIANRRNCEISGRLKANFQVANLPGTIYSLAGRVDVGTDIGGDGAAACGQAATLTINPGVVIFASSGNAVLAFNPGRPVARRGGIGGVRGCKSGGGT